MAAFHLTNDALTCTDSLTSKSSLSGGTELIVKNTFLVLRDGDDVVARALRRTRSDSDVRSNSTTSSQLGADGVGGTDNPENDTRAGTPPGQFGADIPGDSPPSADRGQWLHEQGKCKPCRYWASYRGCRAQADCAFCHMPHDTNRSRPSKTARNKCKRLVTSIDLSSREAVGAMDALAEHTPYLRKVLAARKKNEGIPANDGEAIGQNPVRGALKMSL